jgi:hypothetical protein
MKPPPFRVKPAPIITIIYILHQEYSSTSSEDRKSIVNMATITFYCLLRPGEYTSTTSNDTPFRLRDVELHVEYHLIDTMMASSEDL